MKPRNVGPRLTKKAREKKREAEKADKALGGGTMVEVEGEEVTKALTPHNYIELQWFRLLRGQARLNQIARILVELAPAKVFDPRDIYSKHEKKEASESQDSEEADAGNSKDKKKSGGGKSKKPSRKDLIIAQNQAKMQKEAAARDAEKLRTLGTKAGTRMKLETESGKLLLLLQLLKKAVQENNVVDTLDTMWEIEEVVKDVDPKEAKNAFKPYTDVIKNASEVRTDRAQMGGMNIIDFQLTEMSDRLPPLNLHSLSGSFKLDDWQLHVLKLVNANKSVLITAPTSSGKTVLSTYVCTSGKRVLFVVPSEPLAWQVAAMLRALKLDVSIVVPTLTFVPINYNVVVGTPFALESALTKQIGFDFEYAVFDEVHSLNQAEGPALQRLIRAIPTSCKVLALSATIGNAPDVQRWWETVVGEGEIELVVHKARFINLQRYVWIFGGGNEAPTNGDEKNAEEGNKNELQVLHPCAALTVEYLASDEYQSSDIALTPVDAYNLYKSMDSLCGLGDCSVDVSDLKPKKFFSHLKSNTRITLAMADEYETALKERLVVLAKKEPALCKLVLASLAPGAEDIKQLKKQRKALVGEKKSKDELAKFDLSTAQVAMDKFEKTLQSAEESISSQSMTDLFFHLQKAGKTPAICFQLDSVRCQGMFDGLLRELEERELQTHPEYKLNLERRAKGISKMKDKKPGKKMDDDEAADEQAFNDGGNEFIDVEAPHSDFVLTPPGRGMGPVETRDVQESLSFDLPSTGDVAHPLIRGLRRGIGVYIEGLPAAYHRLVQTFAQNGRLGVVFSDELLAYGVNMPFSSTVFFGDPGADWLTPLLHQQCSGRAGRRGLDRRGHLIYAGFSPQRLKELFHGNLPDVHGRNPLYPTLPLQLEMNRRYDVAGEPLTVERMRTICATPLAEFLQDKKVENYYETAEKWIEALGILNHPSSSYRFLIPELVWELRKNLPESLAIEYILEPLIQKYKTFVVNYQDKSADINQQTDVFLLFCRISSRQLCQEIGKQEDGSPLMAQPLPFPHSANEEYDKWTDILKESQQRILDADLPYKDSLLLPVSIGEPVDNMVYHSFIRNQIDPELPTPVQHHLRERIWNVGEVLRVCANVLGKSAELQPLQHLIRKAFVRIRYILEETSQRNWKKLDDATISPPTPPS